MAPQLSKGSSGTWCGLWSRHTAGEAWRAKPVTPTHHPPTTHPKQPARSPAPGPEVGQGQGGSGPHPKIFGCCCENRWWSRGGAWQRRPGFSPWWSLFPALFWGSCDGAEQEGLDSFLFLSNFWSVREGFGVGPSTSSTRCPPSSHYVLVPPQFPWQNVTPGALMQLRRVQK